MQYTEVDITLEKTVPFSEIIIAKLDVLKFDTFQEHDNGLKCYIQTNLLDKKKLSKILDDISNQTKLKYSLRKMPEKNWNFEWEKNFQPIEINSKCFIRSNFHDHNGTYDHEIIITPKMSFGTGHHETTFLMINKMYDLNFSKKSVLDMGCGTGILSILSYKMGANNVLGIDIDEWAYKNSLENSDLNNIHDIEFIKGDINSINNCSFDIILANINRNIILQDISEYYKLLNKDGEILISGFLKEDLDKISNAVLKLGIVIINKKNKGKWYLMHLKK